MNIYTMLVSEETKKLIIKHLVFLQNREIDNFDIYKIAMEIGVPQEQVLWVINNIDSYQKDINLLTWVLIKEIAYRMLKYEATAVSSDDLLEIAELYNCSLDQIKGMYNSDFFKNKQKLKDGTIRLGIFDVYKQMIHLKKNKEEKKEFRLKTKNWRIINNETLQLFHEKLNEERLFFLLLLKNSKDKWVLNNFFESAISTTKKLRKHINLILNQKIVIDDN